MGTELREIQEIIMYDKDTGEEIGRFQPPISAAEESDKVAYTSTTLAMPPEPNTMFVIAEGPNRTVITIYRPKKFNRFQVWMYKFSFGIKIIQGREKIREYMSKVFWSPEDRK
jgi:hypothetical protein